jgi:hypothetical protein
MPLPFYQQNVFINCPFDEPFRTILEAIVFTVHDCGFVARSALEADDGPSEPICPSCALNWDLTPMI